MHQARCIHYFQVDVGVQAVCSSGSGYSAGPCTGNGQNISLNNQIIRETPQVSNRYLLYHHIEISLQPLMSSNTNEKCTCHHLFTPMPMTISEKCIIRQGISVQLTHSQSICDQQGVYSPLGSEYVIAHSQVLIVTTSSEWS